MKLKPTNILLIGGQDRGKSREVKRLLMLNKNLGFFPYDVNGEYTGKKTLLSMDEFLSEAERKLRTRVVFEEATIFFSNKGREDRIISLLVKHNQNVQYFCFHSLRSVPEYIIELCHYIVLFKTKDNPTVINRKFKDFPEIISLYERVKKSAISTCSCSSAHPKGFHDHETISIEP